MTQLMMYILPMLLGRTFDIRNDKVGVDIYSQSVINAPEIQKISTYRSDYKVIRELSDIGNLLKIEGELSLKVKAGFVKIGGSGSYLKDHVFRDDVVEVLTTVYFQTEQHSIPSTIPPISKWNELSPDDLGTHYVKGIIYGGELVASFKFRAIDKKDIESIKGSVDGAIGGENSAKIEIAGKLEKLQKDLEGKASLEISYYATVPLDGVALTLSGYRDLISRFRDQVQSINGGLGVPIKVELEELAALNENFKFEKNKVLKSKLNKLEIQFDDLTVTHGAIMTWLKDHEISVTEEQEKKIDELYSEITIILDVFFEEISEIDTEMGNQHIDKAFQAYKNGKIKGIPGKYLKAWERIKQEMIIPSKLKSEKITYVHWGKKKCDTLNTTTLIEGYAASAVNETSPTEVLCLPEIPQLTNEAEDGEENHITVDLFGIIHLNPFNKFIHFEQPVYCAVCLGLERSTVITLAGERTCPEGWKKEYDGFYLAGRENSSKTEAICVDRYPDDADPIKVNNENFLSAVTFNKLTVPCILCSK